MVMPDIIIYLWPRKIHLKTHLYVRALLDFLAGCHDIWIKNEETTYQRAMNLIFHELLGNIMKIYTDDIIFESIELDSHLADLRKPFEKI
jgi:hypothetical protein